jgi:serine/tyrosine/threonine adenylyltransferase
MPFRFDNTYSSLPKVLYTELNPTPVSQPQLLFFNTPLALELGLDPEELNTPLGAQYLSGNQPLLGAQPLAQAYAGHQFAHFTRLGDGRAHLLGEHIDNNHRRWDIQLKGSGPTPYSRGGDGRASLGPMLREYIMSEAMHALGIPTSRSLAVVQSGENVYRQSIEPGGILTRVASSHIRVGTFQYAAALDDLNTLEKLARYTIERHYPNCHKKNQFDYLLWIDEFAQRQAQLVSQWLAVGFIHGVMNTDNVLLSGETIDYGPCAFMDHYRSDQVFSSIDRHGRYSYANQPAITHWNITRFAEAILPLIHPDPQHGAKMVTEVLDQFPQMMREYWMEQMAWKLGIKNRVKGDDQIIGDWLQLMEQHQQDFTISFWSLGQDSSARKDPFWKLDVVSSWLNRWDQRTRTEHASKQDRSLWMSQHNPYIIPRNHQVEKALQTVVDENDVSIMSRLIEALAQPFKKTEHNQKFFAAPTEQERVTATFCGT